MPLPFWMTSLAVTVGAVVVVVAGVPDVVEVLTAPEVVVTPADPAKSS